VAAEAQRRRDINSLRPLRLRGFVRGYVRSVAAVGLLLVAGLLAGPAKLASIPDHVYGQELNDIYGWWAAIYPNWPFVPSQSSVWPVPSLWSPSSWEAVAPQSPQQIRLSAAQLTSHGSAVDIIEFNPNPEYPDFVLWKQGYLSQIASLGRAFMLGYEHINGTRMHPLGVSQQGTPTFDMSDPYNRAVFTEDIDFMFREVIVPYLDYYVTKDGRALVYLWNTENMRGDFASLLADIKARYPIVFIGSEWHKPHQDDGEEMARFAAMDGFMGYSVLDPGNEGDYARAMTGQYWSSLVFRNFLRDYEAQHGSSYRLFIPTFQAAFDDSHYPGRSNADGSPKTAPMYPRTRDELFGAAQALKTAIAQDHIYDNYGPMVVYNELFEGAAVIESQPYAAPVSQYHGFGLDRLEIVKQFFAP
jgi:hypothetical protein